jgi:cell division protein FtsB
VTPSHGTAARRTHTRGHTRRAGGRDPVRHHRRVSGPIARPVPAVALPGRAGTQSRGSTGAFERLRALPEHRVVDRLLRGRLWIWLIGLMLGGIVAMQVSLLKLNAGISASVEQAGALERRNAALETEIARLASGERIQQTAADEGMVAPPAGDVAFLTARPGTDPRLAARRMQSPSEEARDVMANGGRALLPLAPTTVAPAIGTTIPAPTADPAAAAATAETPTPTPAATPTPTPEVVEPAAPASPVTGATVAPTG